MRRVTWMVAVVMCLVVVLVGCGGKKDAGSVVKDLDHVISGMDSYQGSGRMVLNTGQQPQEYQVDVWYMNPHFYRISLTNAEKDINQIVLRNDEGVFVLTPHLKKSFRFQSDWPDNQGQVYLYQSLVQSILNDKDRQFTAEKDDYVFDVLANYQNEMLVRQRIWLDKKGLMPKQVEVSDANKNVLVKVEFTSFEFGKKFEKDSFDMNRNMTSWNLNTLPTLADVDGILEEGSEAAAGTEAGSDAATEGADAKGATTDGTGTKGAGAQGSSTEGSGTEGAAAGTGGSGASAAAAKQQGFGIIEPSYIPVGVEKQDITEMKLGEDQAVLLRYSGKYNYSLMEVRPQAVTVSLLPGGELVDLSYTIAVLTGTDKQTLTWTYDGVEYRLSTADLPVMEMIKIAEAVQGQTGK
ncbi:outer membrane lipoprotein-sorting protein [Paenibacillus eucommiae]|uniref:Outer membrane lipoprotein-sorting protein n=1 Tax=Paenibacillus eucommiae TaxID=1355755 RepID=A0ABS4JBJ0_9BACL|nr:outer membrane lipoprotein-sorting protein [Paenibacillus eucommiae]MBP1996104.1 outer membrane lipoprotein-sorting protein [Paenibacillus eucommiae]